MSNNQAPIHSGFGFTSTAKETLQGINLSGKVAIVTGGYSGIGLETTRTLAEAGATVIVPARTPDKARQALSGIPRIEQSTIDLLKPDTIDAFAQEFLATGRPLHLLINNAGIMATPLARDDRGYESQFAANHLGHFHLTARLLPALRQAGTTANNARVISVSSRGHHFSAVDFDDPNFERREYDKWKAYGQSKTANILFALGLDRHSESHGIRAFSLHPGGILTDLVRYLTNDELRAMGVLDEQGQVSSDAKLKTVEQGAATTTWCATSPQLNGIGGIYCEDVDIASPAAADSTERVGVKSWATDPELAERLWTLSEKLTGVRFSF